MDILMRYGFSIEEIKNMMDANSELENVQDKSILELINILTKVGCHEEHIMNIFICNPFVLSRDIIENKMLIKKLENLNFKKLFTIFDSNPYILNLTDKEIEKIYNEQLDLGLSEEEVIDYFYHNTVL